MNISDHAKKRAKHRFKWKLSTLLREAEKAELNGTTLTDAKGQLKAYMTKLENKGSLIHGNTRPILYNEVVYLFDRDTLVTIYQMPSTLRRHYNIQK